MAPHPRPASPHHRTQLRSRLAVLDSSLATGLAHRMGLDLS
ncbi:hypothetical protein [Streptomyces sp. NPDC093261]